MQTSQAKSSPIDIEAAVQLLKKGGPISLALPGFEPREAQLSMMRSVLEAYQEGEVSMIEAGTGTGKSMAYLIPALLWASKTGERTVISTNTINLQEQLLHKDIPLLVRALNLPIKVVLVKGMSNYLCLRKLEESRSGLLFLSKEEAEEMQKIDQWAAGRHDGSKSSLPFIPRNAIWEKVCAESDLCNKQQCPFFSDCYFFKARQALEEAQILIVNHYLLFADLVMRANGERKMNKDPGLLPSYSRIIIDEAHHIEDIATEYFAQKIGDREIKKTLHRLGAEKSMGTTGKFTALKNCLMQTFGANPPNDVVSLVRRLSTDLAAMRNDLFDRLQYTFQCFSTFQKMQDRQQAEGEESGGESKLRLLQKHFQDPLWKDEVVPAAKALVDSILRFTHSLQAVDHDIGLIKHEKLEEQSRSLRFDMLALCERLNAAALVIADFILSEPMPERVRWIQSFISHMIPSVSIVNAGLDVSKPMASHLFNRFSTVVLCSATLTASHSFDFLKKRLGIHAELLGNRRITEQIYPSPFDYQSNALFAVPLDMPMPHEGDFLVRAAEKIWEAVKASRGNAFVLFTSYAMMQQCFQLLEKRLKEHKLLPMKQGDQQRRILLQNFKETDRSVLFATDSFWEGVDVAGEALRCVILVKLPFKVPSDPIVQARSEAIAEKGGDPFFEYSLPMAIVKFKQGFGRLIRHKQDRGCVICLDKRLVSKGYGRAFVSSLPECQIAFLKGDEFSKALESFFSRRPTA